MAVEAGFAGRTSYSRSLVERIRMSRETQWRRLMAWTAAVIAVGVAFGISHPDFVPSKTLQAVISALAGGAGFGAAIYCLALFVLERKVSALFAAVAFSALASGSVLQVMLDFHGDQYAASGWVAGAGWLVAGILLLGSANSGTTLYASGRLQSLQHLAIAGGAVLSFPVAVMPYVIDALQPGSLNAAIFRNAALSRIDSALGLAAAVMMAAAIRANHKHYMNSGDGLAGLLCYFLSAAGAGLLFTTFSSARFDLYSNITLVCLAGAWAALVVGNGLENAFAHKEAGDRLEELETLHDVSWSLVGAGTVSELLDMFVSTLVNKLGAKIAAVYLAHEGGLQLAAIQGAQEAPVGTVYPLVSDRPYPGFNTGHTARAYASGEVQIANDVFVDVEFVPWRVVAQDDGCAASIPLVDQNECIGVLNVYFSHSSELSTTRLRLLATIAAAGTSAVQFALARQPREDDRAETERAA